MVTLSARAPWIDAAVLTLCVCGCRRDKTSFANEMEGAPASPPSALARAADSHSAAGASSSHRCVLVAVLSAHSARPGVNLGVQSSVTGADLLLRGANR